MLVGASVRGREARLSFGASVRGREVRLSFAFNTFLFWSQIGVHLNFHFVLNVGLNHVLFSKLKC